jgi:hypothetical protein
MQHIKVQLKRAVADAKKTERGELMRYFLQRLNVQRLRDGYGKLTMGRMGKILQNIPTKDLYYLKRVCDDSQHFSKKFWWELDPKKHRGGDVVM